MKLLNPKITQLFVTLLFTFVMIMYILGATVEDLLFVMYLSLALKLNMV